MSDVQPSPVPALTCRKCSATNPLGTVRCNTCKASLHPVAFGIITTLGLTINGIVTLLGLMVATQNPAGLLTAVIGGMMVCLFVMVRKGNHGAWFFLQAVWVLNLAGIFVIALNTRKALGPAVFAISIVAALITYLLIRYFHTPAVKTFCSVGRE